MDAGAGTADTLKINIDDPETLLVESTDEATIRFFDGSGGMLGEVSNVEYFEFYNGSDEFFNNTAGTNFGMMIGTAAALVDGAEDTPYVVTEFELAGIQELVELYLVSNLLSSSGTVMDNGDGTS